MANRSILVIVGVAASSVLLGIAGCSSNSSSTASSTSATSAASFDSAPDDPVPPEVVTDIGQKQDDAIKQGLPA
jgi:hypothetical protein